MSVNVKSILNISQVVAKKMVDNKIKGSIVNISSQASKVGIKRSSNLKQFFYQFNEHL